VDRVLLAMGLALVSLAWSDVARADTPFDGKWKQSALREDYTVPEWSPSGCGPAPVSSMSGGGEIVSVHQEGDELAIAGGGRVYRTNQCYDQQPTLARETHSRDASGRSWRTRCSTPANDPRRAMLNTLVVATSDTHIDVIETGRYEIMLAEGHCVADVRRSREFDLVARDLAAPAASTSGAVAVQAPTPLSSVTAVPPPTTPPRPSCDSPGDPARLEVRPSRKLLRTGESYAFHAVVLDANGCATGTPTTWSIAPGGGTTLTVDGSGHVSAPVDAAEGSAQVLVTAAGRSAHVTIDVASPAHYDELLVSSGLNAQGENDAVSVAETGSIGAADARAEDTAKKRRTVFLVIVGGLVALLGLVAWVFARRQKRATMIESIATEEYEEKRRAADERRTEKRAAHDAQVKAHEDSLRRAKDMVVRKSAEARAAAEETAKAGPARMVCPTCRRDYPTTSAFCPQDATKLVAVGTGQAAAPGAGSICPACKRGFPAGTRVCPNDGEELVPYAMHAAVARTAPLGTGTVALVGKGKICPTCGGRFDGAAAFCGKDGTALVLIN
jgi:hypothetical protein